MVYALHQLLTRAAARHPEHPALRDANGTLTYAELEAASNGVARSLIDAGVQRGDRVALFLPKTAESVVAAYGVMKAGAAYVPIDPKSPLVRAGVIARDCTVAAVVTTPGRAAPFVRAMEDHVPRIAILVGGDTTEALPIPSHRYGAVTADPQANDPGVAVTDADLAYILYTSGSTGRPKGVMLSHRHALTFVEWCADSIGSGHTDRFSSHAPLHFDLSVFDLYVAAHGGAMVSIVPEDRSYFGPDLARFIKEERITVWYSVPSALMLLVRTTAEGTIFPSLRTVVFAGEVYPTKHLRALRALLPAADLWNLYGPTETNVCTYHRVDELPEDDGPIPIGRACGNTDVFALRPDGSVAGIGEDGELYVRGSAVMRGYWGRPERTAEVLVPNPLQPMVPELVYRTGDLVRLRADGAFDFLGRRDHQIKSRGYRIELGEIEASLHSHPALEEAVAVAVPHEEWGTAIHAFVVPREGSNVSEADVKRHAAGRLPRYMVPARVESRATLPRTSTGKVDRQQLAAEAGA
jgi:amino acid adenylation domain-containing protein